MAFFAFFCDFLRNYELSAENRIIKQIEKHKRGADSRGPPVSEPGPPPPLLRPRMAWRGGGGAAARPRLAGGGGWPSRSQGTPAGLAQGRAGGGRGEAQGGAGAAARGGARDLEWRRVVPATAAQGGGGSGRREHQGARAALGRAEVAPREEQRGLAACAGGGRRVRGGAAALRRRQPRIRVGNRSKSMSRPWGNSPGIDLGRRMAGRWSSTRGAELQWRTVVWCAISAE